MNAVGKSGLCSLRKVNATAKKKKKEGKDYAQVTILTQEHINTRSVV